MTPMPKQRKEKLEKNMKKWCKRHNLIVESETKFWTTIKEKLKPEEKRKQVKGVIKRYLVGIELIKEDPDNELENSIIEEKKKIFENYIQKLNSLKEIVKVDKVVGVTGVFLLSKVIQRYLDILFKIKKPWQP